MNDDRFEELAALDAFDLLEAGEKAEFAQLLAADPARARQARELRETAAALAHCPPAAVPPAALKARVMATIGAERSSPVKGQILSFPTLIPWAAAAGLALAAAWMGALYLGEKGEARLLRDQVALADLSLRSARTQLEAERIVSQRELADAKVQLTEADRRLANSERVITGLNEKLASTNDLARFKIATLASMLGNSPKALAVAVWDPDRQTGVLKVSSLPALAGNQDYQLWVIDPQYPEPVSGGVFTVDSSSGDGSHTFRTDKPIRTAAKFAVSRERKGGEPVAKGPIVLLGQ